MLTTIIAFYFLIGIIYCVINGGIRKLSGAEDDWSVAFVWIFLWWIPLIALIIHSLTKLFKKTKKL